jgi:catechol 2,3-dioxygenase-like lactoylglutathione lyase family enzyme
MAKSIAHIGFSVKNLKASIHFYCNILGFREVNRMELGGEYLDRILAGKNIELEAVFLQAKDGCSTIELLNFKNPVNRDSDDVPFFQTGLNHFSIFVEDIDSIYKQLLSENYELNSPPLASPDGQMKICFVREPNGIFIELIQNLRC